MASAGAEKEKEKEKEKGESEVVSVELPAPEGWVKKFTPKQGGTPRRNEVIFISPTGEEIKNRRQLDQYLRSHPGGPPSSSFDWGTGDAPRRSTRISEKVKISPEAEKPTRASRSSERVKTSLEVEMTKEPSSSGLQKGTKRKKNAKDNGDEVDGEALEGDDCKDGDVEDAEVSKKEKRRKAIEFDGHKAETEGYSTEGDGPKDVDMDEIEQTHGLVDKEFTDKGNVEESVEPHGESQGAIDHELADNSKENVDEKIEQDMELSEGGKELEPEKTFKETPNDTGVSPTPPSYSKKAPLIEKKDGPKYVDMIEVQEEASNEGIHGLVEDKPFHKNNENIQEKVEHEETEKARKGDNIEEPEQSKAREAATTEGVYGSVEHELTAGTEEIVVENVEQPAGDKHESAIVIEETVKEITELLVEIQGEIKQELADKAKENDDMEEAEGTEHSKSKGEDIRKGFFALLEPESAVETAIENKFAVKMNKNGIKKVEQDREQAKERATELEPEQQVEANLVTTDACPPVSEEVALNQKDGESPSAETLSGGGGNNVEVAVSGKNNFEQRKEIGQCQIDAEAFQPAPGSEKGVSAAKNDESSSDLIKGTLTLSENGGKQGEVVDFNL